MTSVERLSISIEPELAEAIRDAADEAHTSVSAWLAEAAENRLLLRQATRAIADYEAEHGEITLDELERAERAWQV